MTNSSDNFPNDAEARVPAQDPGVDAGAGDVAQTGDAVGGRQGADGGDGLRGEVEAVIAPPTPEQLAELKRTVRRRFVIAAVAGVVLLVVGFFVGRAVGNHVSGEAVNGAVVSVECEISAVADGLFV
ncbi:hypothetical protein [Neoactinobaculum massilliense]|uniref:hypothetical protein n=1 Tax=Neoactinobaculum massilliense TaxID=2364794 RepID=UPI000F53197A|nr:hypothetical protein [Neoactinobaculum massilliense]